MRPETTQRAPKLLLGNGARDRTTSDLLAVLLGGTDPDPEVVREVARAIESGEMTRAAALPDELSTVVGLPPRALVALVAAFELARRASLPRTPSAIRGPADVAAIAQRELGGMRCEQIIVIACDAANRPLRTVLVAQGAVDCVPVPVREVLHAVLRCDGRAFALAHNHPDGESEPSDADIAATERIASAARVVGLRFLGHVLVTADGYQVVTSVSEPRRLG